jgi:hypothetical protein
MDLTPELFNFDLDKLQLIVNEFTIPLVGTYDEPWFSGKEFCIALGYQCPKKTLLDHIKNNHKIPLSELNETWRAKKVESCAHSTFFWPFSEELSYHEGKVVSVPETTFSEDLSFNEGKACVHF